MSNLKIDIIYYKTSSDFELEFNLSGCCRMRIFKDKIDTQKGFINTLARDVSRSKIIIVVTDLFGDNSGVPALSKAIGLPLISLNKDEYGIKTDDDVYMPETAVPLVTKTGIYGGCIIESGPQSIIIVSSIRSLRHEIMKSYVHNYVFDVGQLMAYKERMGEGNHNVMPPTISNIGNTAGDVILSTSEPNVGTGDIINDIVRPENDSSVVEQATDFEDSSNATTANEDVSSTESISNWPIDMTESDITDSKSEIEEEIKKINEREIHSSINIVHPGVSSVDQSEFDKREEIESYKKSKSNRKGSNILLLIIIILLLIGFGILAYFVVYLPLTGTESSFGEGSFLSDLFGSLFA